MITWKAHGLHSKPIIIYNYRNFYDYFIKLTNHFIDTGFAGKPMENTYTIMNSKKEIIDFLKNNR
jgi:predicted Rossmann-fold nucleotide-binding protein